MGVDPVASLQMGGADGALALHPEALHQADAPRIAGEDLSLHLDHVQLAEGEVEQ
jgi:hypothetical protein